MSSDIFLKIDGIPGESADGKHKDEIDILAWSFGAANAGSMAHGGGGGSGKANFQDLHVTKRVDKASPKLLEACAKGDHIKKLVLVARKQGGEQMEYMKLTMSDVLISSFQQGGSEEVTEQVGFNFSHIEYTYTAQNASGAGAGVTAMKWNVKKNDGTAG